MNMKFLNTFLLLLIIIFIAVIAYFASQRVDRFLDNLAIHDCAMDYHRETTDTETNQKVSRPLEQQVRECAWQKGAKHWNGVWSKTPKESL